MRGASLRGRLACPERARPAGIADRPRARRVCRRRRRQPPSASRGTSSRSTRSELQVSDRRKCRGGEHATHLRISEPRGGFSGKLRTSPGAPRHARSAPPLRRPVRLFPRVYHLLPRRCAHGVPAGEPTARGAHRDVSAGERGGLAAISGLEPLRAGVDLGWCEWVLGTPRGGASVVSVPFASFGVVGGIADGLSAHAAQLVSSHVLLGVALRSPPFACVVHDPRGGAERVRDRVGGRWGCAAFLCYTPTSEDGTSDCACARGRHVRGRRV